MPINECITQSLQEILLLAVYGNLQRLTSGKHEKSKVHWSVQIKKWDFSYPSIQGSEIYMKVG